jgi:hypothetical protein
MAWSNWLSEICLLFKQNRRRYWEEEQAKFEEDYKYWKQLTHEEQKKSSFSFNNYHQPNPLSFSMCHSGL